MRVARRYNYDTNEASDETGVDFSGEKSLTLQSEAKDADINEIVRRFGLTGEIPVHQRVPLDVDIDEVLDYRTCLERVHAAQRSFESMPVDVRNRFDNDPAKLVAFFEREENRAEGEKLGLLVPRPGASSSAAPGGSGEPV